MQQRGVRRREGRAVCVQEVATRCDYWRLRRKCAGFIKRRHIHSHPRRFGRRGNRRGRFVQASSRGGGSDRRRLAAGRHRVCLDNPGGRLLDRPKWRALGCCWCQMPPPQPPANPDHRQQGSQQGASTEALPRARRPEGAGARVARAGKQVSASALLLGCCILSLC